MATLNLEEAEGVEDLQDQCTSYFQHIFRILMLIPGEPKLEDSDLKFLLHSLHSRILSLEVPDHRLLATLVGEKDT
jgi:hypothetical protein